MCSWQKRHLSLKVSVSVTSPTHNHTLPFQTVQCQGQTNTVKQVKTKWETSLFWFWTPLFTFFFFFFFLLFFSSLYFRSDNAALSLSVRLKPVTLWWPDDLSWTEQHDRYLRIVWSWHQRDCSMQNLHITSRNSDGVTSATCNEQPS